ncbi:MAG: phosphoribosylanthranilate isomerase [Dokdonella sp.]
MSESLEKSQSTPRVRIKFCGFTRAQDARAAADCGVDAIGLVMTRKSRRFVDLAAATQIRAQVPPFVSVVTLFNDDDREWVEAALARVRPDTAQFHGGESLSFCEQFGVSYIKAVPMASITDVASYAAGYPSAVGFLLDAHASGGQGGGGTTFDWSLATPLDRPLILAGGLHAGNVVEAIRRVRPFAVDLASGIESAPGIKDVARMRAFVAAVRSTDEPIEEY